MSRTSRRRTRLLAVGVAVILASAAYVFTAANTVPATEAGAGSGAISGYTATGVQYTLNTSTPTNLDQVAFTINPTTANTVKIQLAPAGAWYACSNSSGSITCATTSPQATVAAATQLTVVAVQ